MISALGNTPATGTIYSVSRMRLEVPEVTEEVLKATDPTIVSTSAGIVGSK